MPEDQATMEALRARVAELEKETRLYHRFLDTIPVPVFYEDVQGVYRQCNRAFARFMGKPEEEILGRSLFEVASSEQARTYFERDQRFLAEGGEPEEEERELLFGDGTYHSVFFAKSLFRDERGEVAGLLGAFVDISERKKAQVREKRYRKRLQALASALSASKEQERCLIAREIHDSIGQNLALSKLKLQMARESVQDPVLRRELDEVVATLDEALRYTRNLTFDLGVPVLYQIGLVAALRWLGEELRREYGLEVRYEDRGLPETLGDDERAFLFRSVQELLMNVIKHAETDQAWVVTASQGEDLVTEVWDQGRGFDVAELEGADVTQKSYGLFSLHAVVRSLGGTVEVDTERGRGTRVVLRLPRGSFVAREGRRG